MPLRWEELTSRLRNEKFNIKNAVRRMSTLKDNPWSDFIGHRIDLARVLHQLSSIAR
jgi:DNA primase